PLILDDAARLHEPGREHVVVRKQQRRRELHEPPALVRAELERPGDAQRQAADVDRIADVEAEARKQARLGPCLAGSRHTVRRAGGVAEPIRYPDLSRSEEHTSEL